MFLGRAARTLGLIEVIIDEKKRCLALMDHPSYDLLGSNYKQQINDSDLEEDILAHTSQILDEVARMGANALDDSTILRFEENNEQLAEIAYRNADCYGAWRE